MLSGNVQKLMFHARRFHSARLTKSNRFCPIMSDPELIYAEDSPCTKIGADSVLGMECWNTELQLDNRY
uniref:Uncharacterized protein n=1 Tax=Arundo donax TaxID=35708 RepID=A0A0A9A0V7_ARUDO